MQALVLAAGFGSRLGKITENTPKALVEVGGVSLLELNIRRLIAEGFTRLVVNVHYQGEKVIDFLANHRFEADITVSDERDLLLDTGGALKKAAPLFLRSEPVLVYNVDVLSSFSIVAMMRQHTRQGALATLAVSERNSSRELLFAEDGTGGALLRGWHNAKTDEYRYAVPLDSESPIADIRRYAFSGIAVVEPELFDSLPQADAPYPIIPQYLAMTRQHRVEAFVHDASDWLDVGTPERLRQAVSFLDREVYDF